MNVNAKEATTPGTITIDGSGSQNDIIRVAGNNSYLNVAGDTNAQAFFPSGTTRVYGYRFLPQTGKTDNDTIASSIFLGDEIDQEVFYPNGWTFPFFRQFREWTSVSESGFLLERYTAPQPDKLMIPINYFNESQATTNIRTLAHKIQRNNFIFSLTKAIRRYSMAGVVRPHNRYTQLQQCYPVSLIVWDMLSMIWRIDNG